MTDDEEKIAHFASAIEVHEEIKARLTKANEQSKSILRRETLRALTFGLSLGMLGNVLGWGWQHNEREVWIPTAAAALLLLVYWWTAYGLERLKAARAVNLAAVLNRTRGEEGRGSDV